MLERLDGLPLAIAQAGSFLHESGVSIDTYLRLYDEQSVKVAEALHKSDTILDYPDHSVWTTWNISYDAILTKDKHVANLLVLWSFLDRNDLWYGLFERASSKGSIGGTAIAEAMSHSLGDIAEQELCFIKAMNLLRGYSLIERAEKTQGYMMHIVVHRWVYSYHGMKHSLDLGLLALKVIGYAVPKSTEYDYASLRQRLLPHANTCSDRILRDKERTLQNQHCRDHFEQQVDLADREGTLYAIYNLGWLYFIHGKLDEAEEMYQRALVGCEALKRKTRSVLSTI